jgi:hypothetical protein
MSGGRSVTFRRMCVAVAASTLALVGRPSVARAQACVSGITNSCLTVTYSPISATASASDFANGVAVLGSFTVSVLKCGRTPCLVTLGAQGQPTGGLRLRIGGTTPASIADCPVDLSGVSSPNASQAPVLMQTNSATTFVVWVCRPLSWNPATTPIGTTSTEMRFLLRQGR